MLDYQQLKKIEIDNLSRQELGSSLNFNEILPSLKKIQDSLLFFQGRESSLTVVDRKPIINIYNEFEESIRLIQEFTVNQNESHEQTQSRRISIIEKIRTLHEKLNKDVLSLINSLKLDDTKIQDTLTNIQNKLRQIDSQFTAGLENFNNNTESKISEFNKEIERAKKILSEVEEIKIKTENFSTEKLVERYGSIFSTQADQNKRFAIISLAFFILSLFALITLAFTWFNPLVRELTDINNTRITLEYILTNIIFRLTLLSMGFIVVKESIKNFNANMHLYNLNQHRQNALLSFETLFVNTKNHDTRDLIIQEIARTIYANQDDGYLRTDKKIISPAQIIELIKAMK